MLSSSFLLKDETKVIWSRQKLVVTGTKRTDTNPFQV